MQVFINAEPRDVTPDMTLAEMVEMLQLDARKVAMEVNLSIIPRSLYAQTRLAEGDKVEIVQFIGGG